MATAILGVWIGITLFMWFAAGKSFSTVDRVLQSQNPQFVKITKPLCPADARELLRNVAAEINRTLFGVYGWAQVVLGSLLLALLLWQMPRDSFAIAITCMMLVFVLVLTLVITPQILSVGRSLDFVPRDPPPPDLARFGMLHGAFTTLDGIKLLAGLGLLVRWIMRR